MERYTLPFYLPFSLGKFLPLVDFKWFYWKRYSLNVGITPKFVGLGISRHIDDFTPFKNLEICTLAGLDWQGSLNIGVGLRINF